MRAVVAVVCLAVAIPALGQKQPLRFEVTIADSVQKGERLTGHLILCIARPDAVAGRHGQKNEPRFEIEEGYTSAPTSINSRRERRLWWTTAASAIPSRS